MSYATVVSPPSSLQDRLPLAVVGSNTIIEVNGKRVRGRQYPWGVAEGERSKVNWFQPAKVSRSLTNTAIFPQFYWIIEQPTCVDSLQSSKAIHALTHAQSGTVIE